MNAATPRLESRGVVDEGNAAEIFHRSGTAHAHTPREIDIVAAARWWAARGIPVFPCDAEKRPMTPHGFYDATTDADRIPNMFAGAALIGAPTGDVSGLFVLDTDPPSGDAALFDLQAAHGDLPETFKVRTARGGHHHYFRTWPGAKSTRGKLGEGIDTRGEGGYAILPPSPGYEIVNHTAPAEASAWLKLRATKRTEEPASRLTRSRAPKLVEVDRRYHERGVENVLAGLRDLPRPWRNGAGWDEATMQGARDLVALGNTLGRDLREEFMAVAPHDAVWDERAAKWDRAVEHVGDTVRVRPPTAAESILDGLSTMSDPTRAEAPAAATTGEDKLIVSALDWTALWADDTEEEWILEPILPARRLVALYSPPKVGKSLLMLELAASVAAGRYVLGVTPDRPRSVLYVDFENDPKADIRPRLSAMGFTPADLTNLHYLSFPAMAYLDSPAGADQLLANVRHYAAEVVVIDTVSRAVGGEENENDTWLAFYRHTGLALKQARVACIRLDHTGKDETKGQRGGSAKSGDVDAIWRLSEEVKGETYRLTCEAHRMPVHEPVITINRRTDPLRHDVRPGGNLAAWDAKVAAAIKALDEADVDPSLGRDKAREALLARYGNEFRVSNDALNKALQERRRPVRRPSGQVPADDLSGIGPERSGQEADQ